MLDPVTCVVADDHPAVLEAVSRWLTEGGARILASASNGNEALQRIGEHQPQVALLDVAMPELGGVEAARLIREVAPQTRVLLYTGNGGRDLLKQALKAGACGIVLKDAPLAELGRALRIVTHGGVYIDASLAGTLLPEPTRTDRN